MLRQLVRFTWYLLAASAVPVLAQSPVTSPDARLIVQFRASATTDAVDLAARVRAGDPAIQLRLRNPVSAHPLVTLRILPEMLAALPQGDPRRGLHNSVVLRYPSADAARAALSAIRLDADVVAAREAVVYRYSAAPTDPLLNPDPDISKYQWAAGRLALPSAWQRTKGHAYVGVTDNGIQTKALIGGIPRVHEDLVGNFRPQFSRNLELLNGPGGAPNTAENVDEEPYNVVIRNVSFTNVAGHGTHVAGIIAASANTLGGAGACPLCSLIIGRISYWDGPPESGWLRIRDDGMEAGWLWMTHAGAQVVSNSFGGTVAPCSYPGAPNTSCAALDAAELHDVVMVAAAGNARVGTVDFPAQYPGVLAVGGAEYDPSGVRFWSGGTVYGVLDTYEFGSNWSPSADMLVAPANTVLSTMYLNGTWNRDISCGDNYPLNFATNYGTCSGTSMAAPYVAGIAALARSAQPTASRSTVRAWLTSNTSPCVNAPGAPASLCGYGIPDAGRVVQAALGAPNAINRLSPLFSFYSSDRDDHFYTVAPQMGTAAILGTLLPFSFNGAQFAYSSIGPLVPGYSLFPGVPLTGCEFSPPCSHRYPRALVSVFTTSVNPVVGGPELVPLYRVSWNCPYSGHPDCPNNPNHVSHVYSTDVAGEGWLASGIGYRVDGIEGYVFPKTATRPAGAVKLCRKYYGTDGAGVVHDDYILFPGQGTNGSDCSAATDGYTPGGAIYTQPTDDSNWIGWVYPAVAPQPVYRTAPWLAIVLNDE